MISLEEKGSSATRLAKRRLSRDIALKVGVQLFSLAIMIIVALYLLTSDTLASEEYEVPTLLLPATVISVVLIMSATMVNQLFVGTMARPISDALLIFALTSFLAILLHLWPDLLPEEPGMLPLLVLVIGGMLALNVPVKAHWELGGLALRSFTLIVAAALVLMTVPPTFLGMDMGKARGWISLGLLALGTISLLSVLRRHSDPHVRAVGILFSNGILIVTIAIGVVLLALYKGALRPMFIDDFPDQLVLLEWAIIGAVMAMCCAMLRSYLKKKGKDVKPGDWGKHIQDIRTFKPELNEASKAVNDFIEGGHKEDILVMMTSILLSSGASETEISDIVRGIVRYSATPAALSFKWVYGDAEAAARQDREALVSDMVSRAASTLHAGYLVGDRGAGTA